MNQITIETKINERVLEINKNINKTAKYLFINGLTTNDIVFIERVVIKVARQFNIYKILFMLSTSYIFIDSVLQKFNLLQPVYIGTYSFFLIITLVLSQTAFKYYKVKVLMKEKLQLLKLIQLSDV